MMDICDSRARRIVPEEVLSLASNKKYIPEMGKVGKHQGLIILLLVNEKDSM
jgi:hypothetical protein